MAVKPIKSLELHYTMIQFLIIYDIYSLQFASFFPCALINLECLTSDLGRIKRVHKL